MTRDGMLRVAMMTRARMLRAAMLLGLAALVACSSDPEPALKDNPLCKFDCPARDLAQGNSAVSGVVTADTLFQATAAYRTAGDHASAALERELAQLRVDFDIGRDDPLGAGIRSQGADMLGQSPKIVAKQARCWIDSAVLNTARSQCDGMEAAETIACTGACRVEPGTDCTVSAVPACQKSSNGALCGGQCTGTCTDEPGADGGCDGVCLGECAAACDKYTEDADGARTCAGRCAGRCAGQCVRPVIDATCRGACAGTCTQDKWPDGCDDAIDMLCVVSGVRTFDCAGPCKDGFKLNKGNAECDAAAKAQANLLALCDAPAAWITRAPADPAPDARERRYLRALQNLEVRLPDLLSTIAHARLVKAAGQELGASSAAEVSKSFADASENPELPIQDSAGLACAIAEAPRVSKALEPSERRLNGALADAEELLSAFEIK